MGTIAVPLLELQTKVPKVLQSQSLDSVLHCLTCTCESTSWRFQPGEGPSTGLLRGCTTLRNLCEGSFEALLYTIHW